MPKVDDGLIGHGAPSNCIPNLAPNSLARARTGRAALTGGAFLSVQALDHVEHGRRVVAALPFLRNNSVDATDLHLSLIRKLNLTVQSERRTRREYLDQDLADGR